MKRTLSIILMLVMLVCSSAWSADVKVSALPATTTLTDDDLFLTSTYLTGVYTSKKITVTSLKTVFQPYDATLLALAAQTETEGSIQYYTAAATPAVLAIGAPYALLMTNSGATAPAWTYELGATGTRLTKIWATDMELTNLPTIGGAAITTLLQAKDTDLDIFAGITPSTDIQYLLASSDYATARTNLGVEIGANVQAYSDILAGLAGVTPANNGIFGYNNAGTLGLYTNHSHDDSAAQFYDTTDATKTMQLECGSITTGTKRTLTVPNADGTIALVKTEKLAVFNIPGTSDDGTVVDAYIPVASTITGVIVTTSGAACSAVVDIWSQAYADFPPENAQTITASAPPTLTTAQMSKDTTLTGWTKPIAADTILRANLDSSDCAGNIQVTLIGTK